MKFNGTKGAEMNEQLWVRSTEHDGEPILGQFVDTDEDVVYYSSDGHSRGVAPADSVQIDYLTARDVRQMLTQVILSAEENGELPRTEVTSYAEAGILTVNEGFVMRLGGAEFHVTVHW